MYIYIFCTLQEPQPHSAGVVYRSSLFKTGPTPIYCLGGKVTQDVTFLWYLVRGIVCVGSFPHPQFPLSHQSSVTSLYFGHKCFAKITKLPSGGQGLYTYQTPFNHQIKG